MERLEEYILKWLSKLLGNNGSRKDGFFTF
jgi:hypothetical protein